MQLKSLLSPAKASTVARIVTTGCLQVAIGFGHRAMSREEFGLWAILLNLMFLSTNFDAGFRSSMSNRLAALSGRKEAAEEERRDTFLTALYVVFAASFLWAAVFYLAGQAAPFERWFHLDDPGLAGRARPLILTTGLLCLAALPWTMCGGIFGSYDEIELGALLTAAQAVAVTGCFLCAVPTGSFETMMLTYFGANAGLSFVMTLFFMMRRGWSFRPPPWETMRRIAGSLFGKSMEFFAFNLCTTVSLIVSTIVCGYTSGAAAAGDFSLMMRIFSFLTTLHLASLSAVGPLITRYAHADDWEEVRRRLQACLARVWPLIFPGLGGLLLVSHPLLLRYWTGDRWLTDYWLAGLLLGWACVTGWVNTYSVFLNSLGLIKVQSSLAYLMLLPSLLLPIWLGRSMGPRGVALAALVTMLPALVMIPIYTRNALRHKLIRV